MSIDLTKINSATEDNKEPIFCTCIVCLIITSSERNLENTRSVNYSIQFFFNHTSRTRLYVYMQIQIMQQTNKNNIKQR
ncbi:hypothetical protein KSF78_0009374 [Schistosoma japonicum]|nr:hypothetical protein KSF78_0009374 [Schistosoma japonicum]